MERDGMEMALSTDIIMDIMMSYLRSRDLLSCRLASKFWNKAASSVLRKRSTMIKKIRNEDQLMELEECMRNSSDFPFAGLWLDKPWELNSDCAMNFFQNFGAGFKRLRLDTSLLIRLHALAPFINCLNRLSILEVGWSDTDNHPSQVELMKSGQADGKVLKLPSVRTFRTHLPCPTLNEDALREIFTAASPSLQIECLHGTPEILQELRIADKLATVKSIKFDSDEDDSQVFDFEGDQNLSTELPSLTNLDFTAGGCISMDVLKKMLFSSQHSLKDMRLDGKKSTLGQLWNDFPSFAKLTMLHLDFEIDSSAKYFFQGRNGHKFPLLKELKLWLRSDGVRKLGAKLSDGLFIVPTVTRIDLVGYVNEDGIKQLAHSFPNVVEITLDYAYYSGDVKAIQKNCGRNPFEIWSVREFKFLDKLTIWVFFYKSSTRNRNYVNMDSFLTGIPVGICENLRRRKKLNLVNSEFNEILRDNPSILELTNLKQLIVCAGTELGLDGLPEDPPYISMVSVWYALEMMPNLRAKFLYQDPTPFFSDQERVNTVTKLEAAFEHAKPDVKIEPYYY